MKMRNGPVCCALLLALGASPAAFAQGRRNQQQQQQQAQAPQPVGPAPQTREEANAFLAMQNEQSPDKRVALADDFIAKYPSSDFIQFAQTFRFAGYSQTGKFKEAVDAAQLAIDATIKYGEKLVAKADADSKLSDKDKENIRKKDKTAVFVEKDSPQFQAYMQQSEQRILGLYQGIIQAYQQLNDAPKMMEWGEKALGFKPDDFNTLMMLSNVMAERPPTEEAAKSTQMKRAEELASKALEQLPKFLASPDSANIPDSGKSAITSQVHYTMGLVYLQQKRLASAEQEFLSALKSNPKDPITYYRLGIAYVQEQKNDQAMESLGKSVFLKGVSEEGAREILKQLWVNKNKSEQGLDDYIKSEGSKIVE